MSSLILAIVVVAATLGYMKFMRTKLDTQYAHMRAGELVTRLGLQLVEGNPEHNLVTQAVLPSALNLSSAKGFLGQMAATQVGGTVGEFKLRAVGQPYGASAELVLYCREDLSPGLNVLTRTTWHDLRLAVTARAQLTPFELQLRTPSPGLEPRRAPDAPELPAQAFGDAALDQRYAITTRDPHLPARLASALRALPPTLAYVHIVGDGDRIALVMTPTSVAAAAMSFEQILHALASMVAALEGRAAPGQLAQAPNAAFA